ncbi:flagellar filament capping protein FliD [Sulfuriflexus sp.]|uniref:flagellar filament capping protein FliD n=1 Tax=Sulfuriflexus sp. TaxID=2015443 RepID=UPI0028CC54FF|nr:flagellar filament capping protein FliD [Sulfuriflexus sp.]MDT8404479.1 flagellar filament capping protein FliD [Sulfuriflexus sp.]
MATITSAGIGSGLDINSLVTQLVAAEAEAPTARLDRRQSDLQLRLSAYGQMKSALSSLSSSLGNLKNFSTFRAYSTTSSDSDIFTATSSGKISKAGYDVNVTGLAENHKLSTDPTLARAQFTDVTDTLSTGSLTFKFGTTSYDAGTDTYSGFVASTEKAAATVTITDSSLEGVRDAINDADIGVSASLIYDGSHYRLAVSSDDTGADNSLQISVSDDDGNNDDAAGLSLLAFNGTATHLEQNAAASDATLTLNGIAISSSSNTVTEAIDGVSINLKSVGSATLNTTTDKARVKSAVTQFVASYNAFFGTVNQLTAYNPETRVAGELNGDGVTRSITSNIQRIIGNPVGTLGDEFTILAEAGITTDPNNGRLVINDATLDEQLDQNFDKFISLFTAFGETADTHTDFVSSTDDTVVGNYAVNITSLATRGELVGSAAANLTIVEGSNDALTLNIDGVTASVTLAAGSYTVTELATELKSKVNALSEFSNAGIRIDVTESGGVLSLLSQSYGSSSRVEITGGNGKTDLVGGAATSTDGIDVAGTIGGVAATGNGRLLTGAGDAAGLMVEITGGSVGERGAIDFKRGYAEQLDSYLGSLLASDGFFKSTTASLENRLENIADERETLGRRLQAIETRLRSQFGALDALIAQLSNTGNFLQQQLDSLPTIGGSGNR